ncbi:MULTISPECIES: helix-turn-helix transcriptional regulator [unclassified Virgibacillus]|uniref:AraC family transcriptional regulator n=1 Tax=unclassified Virgibacillus TaxID=2620237 RepID=UPI0024DE52C0|nr:helix-turn-helix transcriptional regulator [Virgibacillus sp. LDC-1]
MLHINPEHFTLKQAVATIHCEPTWQWKKRPNPLANYDLFYVWSGTGTVQLHGEEYNVQAGHCFLFRPGDMPTATHHPQSPLVLTYIHFDTLRRTELGQIPNAHHVINDRIAFEAMLTKYVRLFLLRQYGWEIEAKLILKQLMIQLLREEQTKGDEVLPMEEGKGLQQAIYEVANYVQLHPGKSHSLDSLASRAQLSPRYFSRKFKEFIGCTVKEHIIRSRVKRAEHLLYHTGMTVTETAFALGYKDIHFFSRQFKQVTGKNPSEFR